MGLLLATLRAEPAFASAYPVALRTAFGAAALLGAALVIHVLRLESGMRLVAASWIWLILPAAGTFMFVPGISILVVWPIIPILCAALALGVPALRKAVPVLLGAAALLFIIIALPLSGGMEEALFIERAAPATLLLTFMFLFSMLTGVRHVLMASMICAIVMVIAAICVLIAPSHSQDAPRHLSIVHEDVDGKGAFLIWNNGPLPAGIRAAAAFGERSRDDGHWSAPAFPLPDDGGITVSFDSISDDIRTISEWRHRWRTGRNCASKMGAP
ncbi:hypothetical protein [Sphingobium boeckii]|uniref:Uncharacterized protein n=1 Tax=Sphingobium boeckii TaxID=1082345 RepID=A0A7W9EG50_9SPHN|nr:hypothetical protein [Sphingobium boeckii]MBB5686376.1 hypothetical protein [Sphingobium boeckii]